jgi:hypothetical protein
LGQAGMQIWNHFSDELFSIDVSTVIDIVFDWERTVSTFDLSTFLFGNDDLIFHTHI